MTKKVLCTMVMMIAATVFATEEYGYHIRLSWVGDPLTNDMNLIFRRPEDAMSQNEFAPGDCYYGQPNPDWGIIKYHNDDPRWIRRRVGITNIQDIVAHELFDIGTYIIIARAHSGEAIVTVEVLRWQYEDIGYRDQKWLIANTTSREARYQIDSSYMTMGTRVLNFRQRRLNKRFNMRLNYTDLMDEITTNHRVRVYLDNELVINDDGSSWTRLGRNRWRLGRPWIMRVIRRRNYRMRIRGISEGDYRSAHVQCNVIIGDYLGTNSFYVNRRGRYRFKEGEYLSR